MPMGPREFERPWFTRHSSVPSYMKKPPRNQMPPGRPAKIHRRVKAAPRPHPVIIIDDEEEKQPAEPQRPEKPEEPEKPEKPEEPEKPEVIVIEDDEEEVGGGRSSSSSSSEESDGEVFQGAGPSTSRVRARENEDDDELQFVETRSFFKPRWWAEADSSECEVISRQQWREAGVRTGKRVKAQAPVSVSASARGPAMKAEKNEAEEEEMMGFLNLEEDLGAKMKGKTISIPKEDSSVMNREVLRQAPEFKQADEQEWASRQLELQKQALEAQKLKRKRKAEAERKQNMENRQKQRLQEMRESQMKEEQTLEMKEVMRGEIQTRLEVVAFKCKDLATLLKRLGINLGAASPSTQQVMAGYKQALFRFHPDQASKTGDLRSQVESEEKFKLINKMKASLPPIA